MASPYELGSMNPFASPELGRAQPGFALPYSEAVVAGQTASAELGLDVPALLTGPGLVVDTCVEIVPPAASESARVAPAPFETPRTFEPMSEPTALSALERWNFRQEALRDLGEVADLDTVRHAIAEAWGKPEEPAGVEPASLGLLPSSNLRQFALETYAPPAVTPPFREIRPQPKLTLVTEGFVPRHETVTPKVKYTSRGARAEDIERLVDVDMIAFRHVYKNYDQSPEEMRADLIEKFTARYEKLGPEWIRVFEENGVIKGHMTTCPTSKPPKAFQSWEKTTDNGTLDTTYDPNGKYLYVVSLSMLSDLGEAARNMLFAHQIGKIMEHGLELAYFESRLPGLYAWVRRETKRDPRTLSEAEKDVLAERYFHATITTDDGREVSQDRLKRIYEGVGCEFSCGVVANAYNDEQSLNYGAVGVLRNPLPKTLQRVPGAGKVAGKTLQAASHSYRLMGKMF